VVGVLVSYPERDDVALYFDRETYHLVWSGSRLDSVLARRDRLAHEERGDLVALAWWKRGDGRRVRSAAFAVPLSLWGAFLLADEVLVAYAVAGVHWRLLTALLATLLAVELLPEDGA